MKVLILGGNRFVGKKLSMALASRGDEVALFNRTASGDARCCIIQGDRNILQDLQKIPFNEYDQIIDMCLYTPAQFELIRKSISDTPYIFISSGAAFKDAKRWPVTEDHETGGMKSFGKYGEDKALVECAIRKSHLNYTILRPTYIDGPGNHSPRINKCIELINAGKEIPIAGTGETILNFVHCMDVVESIIQTIGRCDRESYIVASNDFVTVNSLVDILEDKLRTTCKRAYHADAALFRDTHYGIFDNSKIRTEFKQKFKNTIEIVDSINDQKH